MENHMKWAFSTSMLLLTFLLNACSGDDNAFNNRAVAAQVQFVNLVPNSPALIFDLSGSLFANVSYAQASGFQLVNLGTFQADVNYLNAAGTAEVDVFSTDDFATVSNREYSVMITGSLGSPTVTILDNLRPAEIADGTSEIHFFNGSSLASGVDIYLSENTTEATINGLSPIALSTNGSTTLTTVDSGARRMLVTASGDDTVIYDGGVVVLANQARRLFAVLDNFSVGGDVRMIQVGTVSASGLIDERLPSRIRVANMVSDIAAVDVTLDGMSYLDDLAYQQVSGYTELDADQYTIATTLIDQPAMVLHENNRTLVAGDSRTLVVTGASATGEVQGRFLFDNRRPVESVAQVRVINAAPDAGNLDVYILSPDQLVTDVLVVPRLSNFTLLTNGLLLLEGGEYDVVFTAVGENTILVGPERVAMTNGGIYSIIVSDADGGGAPGEIVLADDFVQ
jgi:hypothetical protein